MRRESTRNFSRAIAGVIAAIAISLVTGHILGRAILRSNFENFVKSSLIATAHEQNTLDLSAYSRLLYSLVQSSGDYRDTSVGFCRDGMEIAFAPASNKTRGERAQCFRARQATAAPTPTDTDAATVTDKAATVTAQWVGAENFRYAAEVPRLEEAAVLVVVAAPRVINPYGMLIALAMTAICLTFFVARERARIKLKLSAADAKLGRIAAQVAHDIRSPLAALESIEAELKALPEESRMLVRSAIGRIKDIANGLLESNREAHQGDSSVSAQLLSGLIDVLVTEKRSQYRARLGIDISARIGHESYGLFADVDPTAFKRVLSNLINNSVEAMPASGHARVELGADGSHALIAVVDDGKGIPREVQELLEQRAVTHGKEGGSGLGLHHAKATLEPWGGSLQIQSQAGQGTRVTIRLPLAKPPQWFVPRIEISAGTSLAIIDDDVSIHQIWRGRLEMLNARAHGVLLHHFSSGSELAAFVASQKPALYLVDYELLGEDRSGLNVIESLEIAGKSILVTSRFEEPEVRARCARLGVRLIPKGMAAFVPIAFTCAPSEKYDAVLIDDEDLVHATWRITAKTSGKRVLLCKSFDEFLERSGDLDRATAIYVDVSLGRGVRGEDVSKRVVDAGFSNVYLATGHQAAQFAHLAWLKGVVGKEPPWLAE